MKFLFKKISRFFTKDKKIILRFFKLKRKKIQEEIKINLLGFSEVSLIILASGYVLFEKICVLIVLYLIIKKVTI